MPEILNEIVIEPVTATFVVDNNNINVTPNTIGLNIYTGSAPVAGGPNLAVQYNLDNQLNGSNTFTFDIANSTVNIDNLQIGNVANLGGTANVKISGGANAYFLQTDGTGNLTWAPGTANVSGIGTAAGANTQIQFSDGAGNFQAAPGFTFDVASNVMNTPGDLIVAGNISALNFTGNANNANFANYAGYVVNSNQSNITVVGTLANLSVNGTISTDFINATSNIIANIITANSNFVGNLNGNATTAGTVTTNAQPNITSLGALTGLQLVGTLNAAGQTIVANAISANYIIGNITANISNSNYAAYAGNVVLSSQPNITSVGTLVDLRISNASLHLGFEAGNTGQGNLGAIAIGYRAGRNNQSNTTIAIGQLTGQTNQSTVAIAIGTAAGNSNQGQTSIALGYNAGTLSQGEISIAIGYEAGGNNQGNNSIALGRLAAFDNQGDYGIAIGYQAGNLSQVSNAVAIGTNAGYRSQGQGSIAIGLNAGYGQRGNAIAIGSYSGGSSPGTGSNAQGNLSIAIGANAGYPILSSNTIVLNATGSNLQGSTANALYIKPIRNATSTNTLYYNNSTGEITYNTPTFGAFYNPNDIAITANTVANLPLPNVSANSGVYIASSDRITVPVAGTYNIQLSLQLKNTDNAADHDFDYWFAKNGTDIADSATVVTVVKNDGKNIAVVNFIDTCAANDYYQVRYAASSANISLEAFANITTPYVRPAIPSAIVTVVPVGA